MERSALPAALRPFAGWKPERLAAPQPRRAIGAALAADPVLREAVGLALDDRGLWEASEGSDAARLVARFGEQAAVAALAARGRWDDLAVVAAASAERAAVRGRAAGEATREQHEAAELATRSRLIAELRSARSERDISRRRAEAAEQRERSLAAEHRGLGERVEALETRVAELTAELADQRRAHARRVERLRRRAAEARERVRVDDARVDEVATRLEGMVSDLRAALAGPSETQPLPADVEVPAPGSGLGRPLAVATPGRPCRLPPGLTEDDPAGVEALLRLSGLAVLFDGYNLTKDEAGRPHATLTEQRAWLLKLAGGLTARFDRRLTVVFDGTEVLPAATPAPRGVQVLFSVGDQTADELIVALVEDLDPERPVLVVTSDRQIRDDCTALGANVAPSRALLRLAGG
jgi:molecular chaperone GrpE (heat shock protein)